MANPTTNFGWVMPTSASLVTNLPADFNVFGQGVDTSMQYLLGGTTGQILSKTSGTNMAFTWIANDQGDITGVTAGTGISGGGTSGTVTVTNSMATEITAKGDLIVGTGSATFDNLAVGSNGETLVADSATATGLRYIGNYAAGKNAIINGAFNVWQRGTSFTVTGTESDVYKADRWCIQADGSTTIRTISQQTFTPGTAPVSGYEGTYFFRFAQTTAGNNTYNYVIQKIEDVRFFAGQTVTLSFWAKADSSRTVATGINQYFGSGGSSTVAGTTQNNSVTTSWTRFTHTISVASISGKTIGTGSSTNVVFTLPNGGTPTIDIWGVQVEDGSVATAFQTATGTLQGELAACQRYYQIAGDTIYEIIDGGYMVSGNVTYKSWIYAVPMRTTPTGTVVGSWAVSGIGQPTLQASQQRGFSLRATSSTTGAYYFHSNTTYYLTFSAEL